MDTYKEPVIIKTEKCTVKVLRPVLSEEERARRMTDIKRAAAELLLSLDRKDAANSSIEEV